MLSYLKKFRFCWYWVIMLCLPVRAAGQIDTLRSLVHARLEQAVGFLDTNLTTIDRDDVIMIACILNDEFSLGFKKSTIDQIKVVFPDSHFQLYGRFFNDKSKFNLPDSSVQYIIEHPAIFLDNMDIRTGLSMYCRSYPLQKNILDYIQKYALNSEYELTHAALQVMSLKREGCLQDQSGQIKKMYRCYLQELLKLFNKLEKFPLYSSSGIDLKNETIAMICYLKAYDLISLDMVHSLLNSQQADGFWSMHVNSRNPDFHSTILGKWALAEIDRNWEMIFKNW